MIHPLPALRVYYLFVAVTGLFFTTYATLSAVYRVEIAGLDPLQLVLLGTALEAAVVLFEVPTGVVADTVSRRGSLIVGMLLVGAGFALEGAVPLFGAMLAAQLLWGVGATFESGALEAWLSDEIGEAAANRALLRGAQLAQLSSLVGIGLATALASVALNLPLLVAGAGYAALALLLLGVMPERRPPAADPHTGRHVARSLRGPLAPYRRTLAAGVAAARQRPLLLSIFAIALLVGASSETFDRLWEAHLLTGVGMPAGPPTPVVWFGLINLIAVLGAVAATEVARRRLDTGDARALARTLLAGTALWMLAVIGFGLAGNFALAVACYWAAVLTRRLNAPLFRAWLNQGLAAGVRATVFSTAGLMDALGQIAGGPLLALLALAAGLPLAFVAAALVLAPALWLYARSLRRGADARPAERVPPGD